MTALESKPIDETWKPLLGPRISLLQTNERVTLETPGERIRFTGESAELVSRSAPLADGSRDLLSIASDTGFSIGSIFEHLSQLDEDDAICWLGQSTSAMDLDSYFRCLRKQARFWNRAIFSEPVASRIFEGRSSTKEVMIWAMEFYNFIKSANRYMAKGVARLDIPIELHEIAIQHYVEEADHEEIFRNGLKSCGVTDQQIDSHTPLPSTNALLNYLFEKSSESIYQYLSVFTVMQPLKVHPSMGDIEEKYDFLSSKYVGAKGFFDACKKHDLIDAGLEHSEWGLEELSKQEGLPELHVRQQIEQTMMGVSSFFCLFYRGIGRESEKGREVRHRANISANAAFH